MWVKVDQKCNVTFVGALYHPPAPLYVSADLLDLVEAGALRILRKFPDAHIVLVGDLNMLSESELGTCQNLSVADRLPADKR
jgi:hypothetical protein